MGNPWWVLLVVALVTGTSASAITYFLNHRKDKSNFIRSKAEDLYSAIEYYSISVKANIAAMVQVVEGKAETYMAPPSDEQLGKSYRTIKMLTNIYFPEMNRYITSIIECKDNINSSFMGVQGKKPAAASEFRQAALNFESATDLALERLAKCARRPPIKVLADTWRH